MDNIKFKNGSEISAINNSKSIKSRRSERKILNDPEGFFKDMSSEEFIKMLNEMEINYKLKDGVNIENK